MGILRNAQATPGLKVNANKGGHHLGFAAGLSVGLNIKTMPGDLAMLHWGRDCYAPTPRKGWTGNRSFINVTKMNAFAEGEAKKVLLSPAWPTVGAQKEI